MFVHSRGRSGRSTKTFSIWAKPEPETLLAHYSAKLLTVFDTFEDEAEARSAKTSAPWISDQSSESGRFSGLDPLGLLPPSDSSA